MGRVVYVNGTFVAKEEARVSVFDRGFLFSDGVYEVTAVIGGHLVDNARHLRRLARSLSELTIDPPASMGAIESVQRDLVGRNGLEEGIVYLQVTRGAADRDFAYPRHTSPSMVLFTQRKRLVDNPVAKRGLTLVSLPDTRWARRDIKTIGLLAASMAKQAAIDAGADDAWMVEDGFVTEGTSHNAYIVTDQDVIVTRHLGTEILSGITREAVLRLSREGGLAVEERPFSIEEAYAAREAFATSASMLVVPVVAIDGHAIGDGRPGPLATRLRRLYLEEVT